MTQLRGNSAAASTAAAAAQSLQIQQLFAKMEAMEKEHNEIKAENRALKHQQALASSAVALASQQAIVLADDPEFPRPSPAPHSHPAPRQLDDPKFFGAPPPSRPDGAGPPAPSSPLPSRLNAQYGDDVLSAGSSGSGGSGSSRDTFKKPRPKRQQRLLQGQMTIVRSYLSADDYQTWMQACSRSAGMLVQPNQRPLASCFKTGNFPEHNQAILDDVVEEVKANTDRSNLEARTNLRERISRYYASLKQTIARQDKDATALLRQKTQCARVQSMKAKLRRRQYSFEQWKFHAVREAKRHAPDGADAGSPGGGASATASSAPSQFSAASSMREALCPNIPSDQCDAFLDSLAAVLATEDLYALQSEEERPTRDPCIGPNNPVRRFVVRARTEELTHAMRALDEQATKDRSLLGARKPPLPQDHYEDDASKGRRYVQMQPITAQALLNNVLYSAVLNQDELALVIERGVKHKSTGDTDADMGMDAGSSGHATNSRKKSIQPQQSPQREERIIFSTNNGSTPYPYGRKCVESEANNRRQHHDVSFT